MISDRQTISDGNDAMQSTETDANENRRTSRKLVPFCSVDPSLKEAFEKKACGECGFSSLVDGLRTLARDVISGRIQYRNGIFVSQPQTSQSTQIDS